jgi:hypothetical protein
MARRIVARAENRAMRRRTSERVRKRRNFKVGSFSQAYPLRLSSVLTPNARFIQDL